MLTRHLKNQEPGNLAPRGEKIFFQDQNVLVTNTRAVIGGTTYAMANITSVSACHIPADRTLGMIISMIGIFMSGGCGLVAAVSLLLQEPQTTSEANLIIYYFYGAFIIVGLLILGLGLFLAIRAKPTYIVRIGSASGETNAASSSDSIYINRIVDALKNSIVYRG